VKGSVIASIIGGAAAVAVVLIVAFFIGTGTEEKTALIVDGLSVDLPNQAFIDEATEILESMGYRVDVIGDVTLQIYEKLPSMGYDLIVFRTHGAEELTYLRSKTDGSLKLIGSSSSLFTTEPYVEERYLVEQEKNYVKPSTAVYNAKPYFAATSFFVKDKMQGEFDDTVIIMMGCYGFPTMNLEESYTVSVPVGMLQKGASVVVGWDGLVGLETTEKATIHLLQKFGSGMSLQEALDDTREVGLGSDSTFGGSLSIITSDMVGAS
jgi:hypothetical protein